MWQTSHPTTRATSPWPHPSHITRPRSTSHGCTRPHHLAAIYVTQPPSHSLLAHDLGHSERLGPHGSKSVSDPNLPYLDFAVRLQGTSASTPRSSAAGAPLLPPSPSSAIGAPLPPAFPYAGDEAPLFPPSPSAAAVPQVELRLQASPSAGGVLLLPRSSGRPQSATNAACCSCNPAARRDPGAPLLAVTPALASRAEVELVIFSAFDDRLSYTAISSTGACAPRLL
nr:unnamed protein product [Digitaria exilis]